MNPTGLFRGIVSALKHRVYYRNDVRMKRNRRAGAGRHSLRLLARRPVPTLHFTKVERKASARWATILNPHSFGPDHISGS
jgi:hypothetical protein